MQELKPFHKPLFVGRLFIILGVSAALTPLYMPYIADDYNIIQWSYAASAFGILFLAAGIIVLIAYGKLNQQFQEGMNGKALLQYTLPDDMLKKTAEKEAKEIKNNNRTILIIMLFFCIPVAVLFPVLFNDILFLYIAIGIAIFITLSFFIITSYRVRKAKNSNRLVMLTKKGAYAFGQYHGWGIAGAWLDSAGYDAVKKRIIIIYKAVSRAGPQSCKVTLPVPAEYGQQAAAAIEILNAESRTAGHSTHS